MLNIVIVAAGLGTRLKPMTDYIPKCLLPYNNKALLLHQYEIYAKLDCQMWLIANSKYKQLLIKFSKVHGLNIKFLWHDKADGSANAIANTCAHLANQPVAFQWCDLLIENTNWLEHKHNIVCLTPNRGNRYAYDMLSYSLKYVPDNSGGVIGAYFHAEYEPIEEQVPGTDFADLPFRYNTIMPKYKDFGDKIKWLEHFALPQDAKKLANSKTWLKRYSDANQAQREFNWYVANKPGFVLNKSKTMLIMQEAKGKQLRYIPEAYKQLIAETRAKADVQYIAEAGNAYLKETGLKFSTRFAKSSLIKPKLNAMGINLMLKAMLIIKANKHCIVRNGHFDLNSYNVFVKRRIFGKYDFELIDPRAHFGGELAGPLEYEISKIYYGMMIWPALNELNELELMQKDAKQLCIVPIDELKASMTELEKAWCCVHLLTAFSKFNKNPMREYIAFILGIQLAKHILS